MSQHYQPDAPTGFPSPEERRRIVERRAALWQALLEHLVAARHDGKAGAKQRAALSREYGEDEVQRTLGRISRQLNRPKGDAEEPWLYDEYVALYRRFGGSRPLLSFEEQRALNHERTGLKMRQEVSNGGLSLFSLAGLEPLSPAEERRLVAVEELLLADADLWDDLVPEEPPLSPGGSTGAEPSARQQVQRLNALVVEGDQLLRCAPRARLSGGWASAAEAEATYAQLIERLPDEGWGYIGWSDQYWWMRQKEASPEYKLGETILKLALIRPSLRDRADVLERLAELYGEWGRPDEQASVAAELAQLRQAQTRHRSAPVISVPAPARKGKPGRNEPCWCGSGRKYKHCHLHADQAR